MAIAQIIRIPDPDLMGTEDIRDMLGSDSAKWSDKDIARMLEWLRAESRQIKEDFDAEARR